MAARELWDLRHRIYRHIADTGAIPTSSAIRRWLGGVERADALLQQMHDRHLLVLDDQGEITRALPFARSGTGHRVRSSGVSWWANCAWDALAIPIAVRVDVDVDAVWIDTGEPVDLVVRKGVLVQSGGFVQWEVPAHRWWDDIGHT